MVMHNGNIAYARDGRKHNHGLLGGGLIDAVRGVPLAEKAARTYRSRVGWGLVTSLGGAICTTVALPFSFDAEAQTRTEEAALVTSLACLGLMGVGIGVLTSAMPYQYDAINIFNDSAQPIGPVDMPGQVSPIGAPGQH